MVWSCKGLESPGSLFPLIFWIKSLSVLNGFLLVMFLLVSEWFSLPTSDNRSQVVCSFLEFHFANFCSGFLLFFYCWTFTSCSRIQLWCSVNVQKPVSFSLWSTKTKITFSSFSHLFFLKYSHCWQFFSSCLVVVEVGAELTGGGRPYVLR